jgi:hypothetical protein
MVPIAGLDAIEKIKILPFSRIEARPSSLYPIAILTVLSLQFMK